MNRNKRILIKSRKRQIAKIVCSNCQQKFASSRKHLVQYRKFMKLYSKATSIDYTGQELCLECIQFNLNELAELLNDQGETNLAEESTTSNSVGIAEFKFTEVQNNEILQRITESLPEFKVIRIEQMHNSYLLKKYLERKRDLFNVSDHVPPSMKFNEQSPYGENYMFHGSSNEAYDNILKSGFDISFSKATGLLGQGIYFAANASYSNSYSAKLDTTIGRVGIMLLCRVMLGKTVKGSTGLTEPPKGANSVSGYSNTYAVFNNFQAYPEYIIYFELPDITTLIK